MTDSSSQSTTESLLTCALAVAQYAISGHPRRTEHWSLLAILSKSEARVYQLKGNYDTFCYASEEKHNYLGDHSLRGGCQVGAIPIDKLGWLKTRLNDVTVVRHDPNFDSQNWIMGAIHLLKEDQGIIFAGINERKIRAEMDEEKERWEVADDILFERLFP